MGSLREKGMETGEGIKEKGRKAVERGAEIDRDNRESRKLLDSIKVRDSDDIETLDTTKEGVHEAHVEAFEEDPSETAREVQTEGGQLIEESSAELENVEDGRSKMEQVAESGDGIGRESAEAGAEKLKESAGEYGEIISGAQETIAETEQKMDELWKQISQDFF